jgi:hypothetical protein
MKPSLKIRAAALLASAATTLVLLHLVALIGHPAVEAATEVARTDGRLRTDAV